MSYLLFNGDMIFPLGFMAAVMGLCLWSKRCRPWFADRRTLALFLAVPGLWVGLTLWAALFVRTGFGGHNPSWAHWPVMVALAAFPIAAALFIRRARGARGLAAGYVLLNIPCGLFAAAVAAMAISGAWI